MSTENFTAIIIKYLKLIASTVEEDFDLDTLLTDTIIKQAFPEFLTRICKSLNDKADSDILDEVIQCANNLGYEKFSCIPLAILELYDFEIEDETLDSIMKQELPEFLTKICKSLNDEADSDIFDELVDRIDELGEDHFSYRPFAIKKPTFPTMEQISEMFNKGGLKVSEIRQQAANLGLQGVAKLNKAQLRDLFEANAFEPDDEDDEEEEIVILQDDDEEEIIILQDDDEDELTIDLIEQMFQTPSKGGLKVAEIREKAKEYGVNIKGITKKADLKTAFLEHAGQEFITIDQDAEESNDESSTVLECGFIITKGPRKGERCTTKPKNGEELCGKHKNCKPVSACSSENSQSVTDNVCQYVAVRGANKGQQCTVKPKNTSENFCAKHAKTAQAKSFNSEDSSAKSTSTSTSVCRYVGTRGTNAGVVCNTSPKAGEEFCAKHSTTQQAINYMANESPVAKAVAEKDTTTSTEPVISRNKELKVWVVDGNLVVRSPKNKKVYAYIQENMVKNEITNTIRELAAEMGLTCE